MVVLTCATMSEEYVPRVNMISRMGAGVVGGVAGGLLLGILLTALGFFDDKKYVELYGQLIGDSTLSTAWVMLLIVAGAVGAIFGSFIGRFITGQIIPAVGVGLVFGMASWLVLAMLVLPIRGEGGLLSIADSGGIFALGIYTLFGVATAVVYALAGPRRKYYGRRYTTGLVMAMPRARRRRKGDD